MESNPTQASSGSERRAGDRRQNDRRQNERRSGSSGGGRQSSSAAILNAGFILALQFILIFIFCS